MKKQFFGILGIVALVALVLFVLLNLIPRIQQNTYVPGNTSDNSTNNSGNSGTDTTHNVNNIIGSNPTLQVVSDTGVQYNLSVGDTLYIKPVTSLVDGKNIIDKTITFAKWASNNCAKGQIPRFDGLSWQCSTEEEFGPGYSLSINGEQTKQILLEKTGVTILSASFTDLNNYLDSLSFNTHNGTLTATRIGLDPISANLDGRYVINSRNISVAAPLQGGGSLGGDLLLSMPQASASASGYLSSNDWIRFNTLNAPGADTLQTVTGRGGVTDVVITLNGRTTVNNTLDVNGKLGIGITDPTLAFQVAGLVDFGTGQDYASTKLGYLAGNADLGNSMGVYVGHEAGMNVAHDTGTDVSDLADYTGLWNTAVGYKALLTDNFGFRDTALGFSALRSGVTGSEDTGVGFRALYFNTGDRNTAVGSDALYFNTSGSYNTAIGQYAGNTDGAETYELTTGSNDTFLGYNTGFAVADTQFNNVTVIGANARVSADNTMVLGNGSVGVAVGYTDAGSAKMAINGSLGLGTQTPQGMLQIIMPNGSSGLVINQKATKDNSLPMIVLNDASGNEISAINTDDPSNFYIGANAGQNNNGGIYNIYLGANAGQQNIDGGTNIGIGNNALSNNLNSYNVAIGNDSLYTNVDGGANTAVGNSALRLNLIGSGNVALGADTLFNNFDGNDNTAIGTRSLNSNVNGSNNVALGEDTLFHNQDGSNNTAIGFDTLGGLTSGSSNIGIGSYASFNLVNSSSNTVIGDFAMYNVVSGEDNVIFGRDAFYNAPSGSNNTIMGRGAGIDFNSDSNNNTLLGYYAGQTVTGGNNNIFIGNSAGPGAANNYDDQLYIADGAGVPTIYGDLTGHSVGINIDNTSGYTFYVNGDQYANGSLEVANFMDVYGDAYFDQNLEVNGITTLDNGAYINGTVNFSGTTNLNNGAQIDGDVNIADGNLNLTTGAASKPGGGSWDTYSDVNLKNVLGGYQRGLSDILQLNPVFYQYSQGNALGFSSDPTYVGFVAQDVQKAIPEAVSIGTDGYLKLNADPILWAIVNAIKEQQGEILGINSGAQAAAPVADQVSATLLAPLSMLSLNTDNTLMINSAKLTVIDLEVTGLLSSHQINTDIIAARGQDGLVLQLKDKLGNSALDVVNADSVSVFRIDSRGKITMRADTADASLGSGTLPANTDNIIVNTSAVDKDSKIFVTVRSNIGQNNLMVTDAAKGNFTVTISDPSGQDVRFDWWVVN